MPEHNGRIIGNEWAKLAVHENEGFEYDRSNSNFTPVCFHIQNFDDMAAR